MSLSKHLDLIILSLIVVVAAILRFYDFSNLPLTHDELSAFYRLKFDSFGELIEKGVLTDTHPAGVQVFLYYWTMLFGFSDMVFKLPFVLFGLASIVVAFFVSKKWFNGTVGLLLAASMATLQFHVMYSQVARPYISGLFFAMLMVYFWSQIVFENKHKKFDSLAGWILCAAVCCYNHHLSLLFAFIVGLTGLFFLKKEIIKPYIISLVAILILYIPHVSIFLDQFGQGGLEWLRAPGKDFIIEHLAFIFHFSPLVYLATIVTVAVGIYI